MIPQAYTCDGSDRSPPLEWSGVPVSAQALVLICDDPDAPTGTWSHWVVNNLPAWATGLKEGVPATETIGVDAIETAGNSSLKTMPGQAQNDFGKIGYGGPCPPSGTHRYVFRLYALDTATPPYMGASLTRTSVLKAIQGHILAEGRLVGKYSRAK